MPPRLTTWFRRFQALFATPADKPSWVRFLIVGGVVLVAKAVLWAPWERRNPFMHWVDVGVLATILALVAVFRLIESGKEPTPPEQHWTSGAGGIDVWMPLAIIGFVILGCIIFAAVAR